MDLRGGFGLRVLAPLWGQYWRQREYQADRYAAAVGQADELADFLEVHALIHDQPVPFIWTTEHTHPPTALRIERLHSLSEQLQSRATALSARGGRAVSRAHPPGGGVGAGPQSRDGPHLSGGRAGSTRVAQILREDPTGHQTGLVTAEQLARRLGMTRAWVYEHAHELGAIRLGSGPKARLRLDPNAAAKALAAPRQETSRPAPLPATARGRPRARRSPVPLLPVHEPARRGMLPRLAASRRNRRWDGA